MTYLPLSWEYGVPIPYINKLWLPLSRTYWITGAGFQESMSAVNMWDSLAAGKSFIIRGCPEQLVKTMSESRKLYTFQTGVQGWLNVRRFSPSSSQSELRRRASRHGTVVEILSPGSRQHHWHRLWRRSVHGQKSRLRHLFHTAITDNHRLFVFRHHRNEEWMGAISLSRNSKSAWHVESLVRHRHAPAGVMDSLLQVIIENLAAEGQPVLSLGEVPFVGVKSAGVKSFLYSGAGKILTPVYNSRGLYRFKNKYVHGWEPVYVVSDKPVGITALLDMFKVSRASALAVYAILSAWSSLLSPGLNG